MKKVTLAYPRSVADEVAQFVGENQMVTLLSWMEVSGMFGDTKTIYHVIAFPEAMSDKMEAKYQKYIVMAK